MSWSTRPTSRSIRCNGEMVAFYRKQRGWTQQRLADVAGYTTRLVAKAESGGSLHPDTIEVLAAALSSTDMHIFPEDLVTDCAKLAAEFFANLRRHQGQVVSKCQDFLDVNIQFFMAGDPQILPFAGRHRGIDAMDRACGTFFREMVLDADVNQSEFLVSQGNEVVVGEWVRGRLRDAPPVPTVEQPVLIVNRMIFERGKIVAHHDYYDSNALEIKFIEHRKLGFDRGASSQTPANDGNGSPKGPNGRGNGSPQPKR